MRLDFGRRCKLGKAKVAQLDVTPSIIEDVSWLEILQAQAAALGTPWSPLKLLKDAQQLPHRLAVSRQRQECRIPCG